MAKVKVRKVTVKGPKGGTVSLPETAPVSLIVPTGRMVNLSARRAVRYLRKGVGSKVVHGTKAYTV